MADPEKKDSSEEDIDPSWLADPLAAKVPPTPDKPVPTPAPRPVEPPPEAAPPAPPMKTPPPYIPQMHPSGRAVAPPEPEPEEEEEVEPREEDAEGEEEGAAEDAPPPRPSGGSGATVVIFVAMAAGLGAAWHFTAPRREFSRGVGLLFKAERTGDSKAAAQALKILKDYVDKTGQGHERLFEAAAEAGDEALGAVYEDRLMKSRPAPGAALLAWYESALTYHAVFVRKEKDAFDAAEGAAAKKAIVEKIRAHLDAAKALKPTRAKVVEEFDNGFAAPEAARLLRIDAMHRELAEIDPAALIALAEKPSVPAPQPSTATATVAASTAAASAPAVSTKTAPGAPPAKKTEPDL